MVASGVKAWARRSGQASNPDGRVKNPFAKYTTEEKCIFLQNSPKMSGSYKGASIAATKRLLRRCFRPCFGSPLAGSSSRRNRKSRNKKLIKIFFYCNFLLRRYYKRLRRSRNRFYSIAALSRLLRRSLVYCGALSSTAALSRLLRRATIEEPQ